MLFLNQVKRGVRTLCMSKSVQNRCMKFKNLLACMELPHSIMKTSLCNVYPLTPHFYIVKLGFTFLAHLSQRLIGELIGYSWSGVRPSASSVVHNFKRLLLQNRWADQSQILCGASLGRGNDILFAASGSHDQDGRHAHIW